MTHYMNLLPHAFSCIANGTKTIELRLNDKKRSLINVGDKIHFTNTEDNNKTLLVKVVALHSFKNFTELYKGLNLLKCGYTIDNIAQAKPEDMDSIYSPERQIQYGALGIEIQLI